MTAVVLDFYGPQPTPFYPCIKAGGASGIARYLTASPTDPRQITPQEVKDAHAAGLEIHFFYEGASTTAGYFAYAQGIVDCRAAMDRLRELGAAPKTVVYFAVDVNLDPQLTIPYFNAIDAVKTDAIAPGVYGYQAMVGFARTRFPNIGQHLAQTYGSVDGSIDLWQHLQEDRCGVTVDVNDCYVDGWKGADMTDDELRAAIKRIYAGPGGLEEMVKADVRVMVEQDAATQTAIRALVPTHAAADDLTTIVKAIGAKLSA